MVGEKIRMGRVFDRHSGRTVIVPRDHGGMLGPVTGLTDIRQSVNAVVEGGADAGEPFPLLTSKKKARSLSTGKCREDISEPRSMKRSWRDKRSPRICIPIVERTSEKALMAIQKANGFGDLIELRMDYQDNPELAPLLEGREKPFIVTNRRKEEGGRYKGDEKERLRILEEALDLGADYVDVEVRSRESCLKSLAAYGRINRKKTRIILSYHDFQGTPSFSVLKRVCDRMNQWGTEVLKIVTFAQSWEDNLKVLSLISYARRRKTSLIAFCMGEHGKISRVMAPLMGIPWTYASFDQGQASAPGQLTAQEMRKIWRGMR